MSTTTSMKTRVNLLEKSITYTSNSLVQLGYRIEHGRVGSGATPYMTGNHRVIENGFQTWLSEQKLLAVHFELFPRNADGAFEKCQIDLAYAADPKEEVVKPPIEELEALFTRLEKLPPDAQFRVVVTTAPGASEVEGWYPTTLKELRGGVKEEVELGGEAFGFGHIHGKPRYLIGKRREGGESEDPPAKLEW